MDLDRLFDWNESRDYQNFDFHKFSGITAFLFLGNSNFVLTDD